MLTEDQAVDVYYQGCTKILVYPCRVCGKNSVRTRKAKLAKHTGRCANCYREMRSNRSGLGGMAFRLRQLYNSSFLPEQVLSAILFGCCKTCKKLIPVPAQFSNWAHFLTVSPADNSVELICYECRLIRDIPIYRIGV